METSGMAASWAKVGAVAAAALLSWSATDAQSGKPADDLKSACARLAGQTVPPVSIGFPSRAATLASATLTPAAVQAG